jgi:predicted RNA-binding Zn-ribbon protein involved in translation (DUF1610 family)
MNLTCKCGQKMVIPDGSFGKKFLCPGCGATVLVREVDVRLYEHRLSQTRDIITRLKTWSQEAGDLLAFDLVIVTGPKKGCPVCDPLVGIVYSISGQHPDYPPLSGLNGGPPFHMDCCHSLAPFSQKLEEAGAMKRAELTCACGQRLRAPDGLIGSQVRCPKCMAVLSVPRDDSAELVKPARSFWARPWPRWKWALIVLAGLIVATAYGSAISWSEWSKRPPRLSFEMDKSRSKFVVVSEDNRNLVMTITFDGKFKVGPGKLRPRETVTVTILDLVERFDLPALYTLEHLSYVEIDGQVEGGPTFRVSGSPVYSAAGDGTLLVSLK